MRGTRKSVDKNLCNEEKIVSISKKRSLHEYIVRLPSLLQTGRKEIAKRMEMENYDKGDFPVLPFSPF